VRANGDVIPPLEQRVSGPVVRAATGWTHFRASGDVYGPVARAVDRAVFDAMWPVLVLGALSSIAAESAAAWRGQS
jgi:hypothetical protein